MRFELRSDHADRRRRFRKGLLIALLGLVFGTAIGDIAPEARRARDRAGGDFSLFAGPTLVLQANQLQCALDNIGDVCSYGAAGLNLEGGYWPLGTPDNYIFNTGIQLAGILSDDAGPWAGDTVGVYIYDASWGNRHGTKLTNIYDSLNPDDVAEWPVEAYVDDPEIFAPILLGRKAISQQDSWVRYWDGDPTRNSNRKHPMGVAFTQRSMSWNYPAGNESVIYFIFEIENVTADPNFQQLNEQAFFGGDRALPDEGWTITEMYTSFGTDMDVGNFILNFSTAILPFDVGLSYVGTFENQFFEYPPSVFYPPFFTSAPGLVGIKYLKSPLDPVTGEEVGLTLFSITQNPGFPPTDFGDPSGDAQLWRYLSGKLDPGAGDGACNVAAEITTANPSTTERSVCYVAQRSSDARFFQASGPFDLAAGQTGTIVVAYIAAPTVETMPDGSSSGIVPDPNNANRNPPGFPSFHPGFASARACDLDGSNCSVVRSAAENAVLPIERGAGWIRYEGPPPSGSVYAPAVEHPSNKLEEYDVRVVPGSFLGRALVAQTVFDNQFLLGFPPDPPVFYLVPGNDQVTVFWEPSATETDGDPFYEVTSDPESALYNPNYRRFDVEGYRVWRSTTVGGMELIAQFDYAHTRFLDHTCETVHPDEDVGTLAVSTETGNLIPVIGYAVGEICPFDESNPVERRIDTELVFNNGGPGGAAGEGVTRNPAAARVDTVILADRVTGPVQQLSDTGIPFVYIDRDVVSNFTYFYSVTSFDVNSMASGPHTLRSTQVSQNVTPRATNSGLGVTFSEQTSFTGDDDVPLALNQDPVQPDPETGVFPSPQPPSNALETVISPDPADVADLLSAGSRLSGVVDSVVVGNWTDDGCPATFGNEFGMCWKLHMTFDNGTERVQKVTEGWTPMWEQFAGVAETGFPLGVGRLPFGADELERYGIPAGAGEGVTAGISGVFQQSINYSANEGQANRRQGVAGMPTGTVAGGSRWFSGTEETLEDPTTFIRVGHLEEADSVWAPIHHTERFPGDTLLYAGASQMQCFGYHLAFLGRAADVRFTWGGGTFAEVRDLTHHVPVGFHESPRATWGFLNTDGNGNGVLDWQDFDYLDGVREPTFYTDFCELNVEPEMPPRTALEPVPQIQPVYLGGGNPLIPDDSTGVPDPMPATGDGFGLYVNGERYLFIMDQLPADGTVWTLRTYTGTVLADDSETTDPSNYRLTQGGNVEELIRPPLIPGLRFTMDIEEAGQQVVGPFDLKEVHAVPDPYLGTSRYDRAPTTKKFMFVNLPPRATLRIYTVTGVLVDIVEHDDPSGGGRAEWDMRNRNNQFVASGVYFFHVVTPERKDYVGKFTIINSVQ